MGGFHQVVCEFAIDIMVKILSKRSPVPLVVFFYELVFHNKLKIWY